jgi:hypothetical protein
LLPLLACFEVLLSDSVLRRVLKQDADVGCGVLMAVLVAFNRAGVALGKKVQESVSKVRPRDKTCLSALHVLSTAKLLGYIRTPRQLGCRQCQDAGVLWEL